MATINSDALVLAYIQFDSSYEFRKAYRQFDKNGLVCKIKAEQTTNDILQYSGITRSDWFGFAILVWCRAKTAVTISQVEYHNGEEVTVGYKGKVEKQREPLTWLHLLVEDKWLRYGHDVILIQQNEQE